jgi:hypothetical protein
VSDLVELLRRYGHLTLPQTCERLATAEAEVAALKAERDALLAKATAAFHANENLWVDGCMAKDRAEKAEKSEDAMESRALAAEKERDEARAELRGLKTCSCSEFDDGSSFKLVSFAGGASPDGEYSGVTCERRYPDGTGELIRYKRIEFNED